MTQPNRDTLTKKRASNFTMGPRIKKSLDSNLRREFEC